MVQASARIKTTLTNFRASETRLLGATLRDLRLVRGRIFALLPPAVRTVVRVFRLAVVLAGLGFVCFFGATFAINSNHFDTPSTNQNFVDYALYIADKWYPLLAVDFALQRIQL